MIITSHFRRIFFGLMSQGYSQAITVGLQLLSVPILISGWGLERYGTWILLSTIPSYIGMADLGFSQIAANEMTIKAAAMDTDAANKTFHTACLMVTIIGSTVFSLFTVFAFTFPLVSTFHLAMSATEASWTLCILCLQVIITICFGLLGAGLRAIGLFALMVFLTSTSRLIDGSVVLLVALCHGPFWAAALSMLALRVAMAIATGIFLFRKAPWLTLGLHLADFSKLKAMLKPSLSYMSYTLSFALSIQGVTLMLGALLGPAAVVAVSAVRTLSRMGTMGTNMFNHTFEPEYSRLFGSGDRAGMNLFYKRHISIVFAITVVYFFSTLILGPWIISVWTRGEVTLQYTFLTLMVLSVVFEMLWSLLQTPYVATNRHNLFALVYFICSCSVLPVVWLSSRSIGIYSVAWATLSSNLIFLIFTIWQVYRVPVAPRLQ